MVQASETKNSENDWQIFSEENLPTNPMQHSEDNPTSSGIG